MKFNLGVHIVLATVVLCVSSCTTSSQTPPNTVTVIEPQTSLVQPTKKYVYNQQPETNKVFFDEAKSRQFVSQFSGLYVQNGKEAPAFAIRVNPTADGQRTVPNQFQDQQATADLARFFGRPLREGGIKLVDETVNSGTRVDIAINVLISWRNIQLPGFNGEMVNKSVPDVQVTAVRLEDGAVLGQAGTSDLIGLRQDSWVAVDRVGYPELMHATALVLLEDMVNRRFNNEVAILNQKKDLLCGKLPQSTANPGDADTKVQSDSNQPTPKSLAIKPIDLSRIALEDDVAIKQQADRLNQEIANVNRKSDEIELWKIALVGDDKIQKLQDKNPMELVRNSVKENYQTQ